MVFALTSGGELLGAWGRRRGELLGGVDEGIGLMYYGRCMVFDIKHLASHIHTYLGCLSDLISFTSYVLLFRSKASYFFYSSMSVVGESLMDFAV